MGTAIYAQINNETPNQYHIIKTEKELKETSKYSRVIRQ